MASRSVTCQVQAVDSQESREAFRELVGAAVIPVNEGACSWPQRIVARTARMQGNIGW